MIARSPHDKQARTPFSLARHTESTLDDVIKNIASADLDQELLAAKSDPLMMKLVRLFQSGLQKKLIAGDKR